MNAGRFDTKIAVEAPVVAKGTRGESVTNWNPLTSIWGEVKWGSSSEAEGIFKLVSEQTITVTTRYLNVITEKHRLVIDDTAYYVDGKPRMIGRRRYMEIIATSKNG